MSQFLEVSEHVKTRSCHHKEAVNYVIEEFRENFRSIYPNRVTVERKEGVTGLKMYGSPQELLENVEIYRNFSESYRFFGTDEEPFQRSPIVFESLQNEKFIQKSDVFVILQNILASQLPGSTEYFAQISYYLDSKDPECMEFVRFDQRIFDNLHAEIWDVMHKIHSTKELKKYEREFSKLNFEQIFSKLKELTPGVWNEKREEYILERLADLHFGSEVLAPILAKIYWTACGTMKTLPIIIDKHPELFRPHSEIKGNSMPVTVRMFEDGNQKFVMKSELSDATGDDSLKCDDDIHVLHTMNMQEVMRSYGNLKIKFIRYPIRRAKHRAVPIKAPTSFKDFFILAVDAFFELLKDLIFGVKTFQVVKFDEVAPIFRDIEKYFEPECKTPYFIKIKDITVMKQMVKNVGEETKANDVREAKKDGFTVEDLKNELKHLGLDATFPEIEEHVEVVYKHVDSVKKEKNLRTCDLFDAIEQCQLICVLNRLPNLKKFVHNQKGCGRIPGLRCEDCEGIQKKMSDEKPLKSLKIESSDETSSQKKTSGIQNSTNEGSNNSDDDKENQNPIKDQKTSKKMVSDIMKLLAQRSKVPIEILKENSENCVSEESQQQSQFQKELKEKIMAKTEENQRLHETILKLTAEHEANQKVIQQLLDKLAVGRQKKDMEEVSDDFGALLAVRIPPVVICYVCHKEIESNDDDWLDCSRTGEKFHQVCAYFHIRFHEECPACDDKIPNYF